MEQKRPVLLDSNFGSTLEWGVGEVGCLIAVARSTHTHKTDKLRTLQTMPPPPQLSRGEKRV